MSTVDRSAGQRASALSSFVQVDGLHALDRTMVGGKAHYLNVLCSLGLNVPPTVMLPVGKNDFSASELAGWLDQVAGSAPWPTAVRSSSAEEDASSRSNAGKFLTLLGTFDRTSICGAIEQVRSSGPDMAVVVQPLIDALLSGVAFSLHPLTHKRSEFSIVWTQGLADKLVSGEEAGHSLVLQRSGDIPAHDWPIQRKLLEQLRAGVDVIERTLGGPVDIEWVVDKQECLWFVQARPVVLPEAGTIILDTLSNFERLPALVRDHPKIRLRRLATQCGVEMAPAAVEIWSGRPPTRTSPLNLGKAAGVSVVLLHPERINQEIVREFAPLQGSDVECFARGCRRYCVRRYPRIANVVDARNAVLEAGIKSSWTSVAIVQSIWDALASGIIRKSTDGYLINVAQGHFVPKGVVPTSTAILSNDKRLISATWREQSIVYHFIDGHVVTESDPRRQLKLSEDELAQIAASFDPLFEIYPDAALEFGVVERGGGIDPYLIDMAEGDVGGMDLDADMIRSGVLSVGRCQGRLYRLQSRDRVALDSHLNNQPDRVRLNEDDLIIVAKRASVDLLPYVGAPGVVGFVFEQGAILAHLAVVLREKGIPAVALDDTTAFDSLLIDSIAEMDASTGSLLASQRVTYPGARNG